MLSLIAYRTCHISFSFPAITSQTVETMKSICAVAVALSLGKALLLI